MRASKIMAVLAMLGTGGMGLYGVSLGVEYSGWMIFIAVIIAMDVKWKEE